MARKRTNPLDAVAKRFGVTVREARDIATAVSTAASLRGAPAKQKARAIENVKKQVKEAGRAAATGKKGTRSGQKFIVSSESGEAKYGRYVGPARTKRLKEGASWKESKKKK